MEPEEDEETVFSGPLSDQSWQSTEGRLSAHSTPSAVPSTRRVNWCDDESLLPPAQDACEARGGDALEGQETCVRDGDMAGVEQGLHREEVSSSSSSSAAAAAVGSQVALTVVTAAPCADAPQEQETVNTSLEEFLESVRASLLQSEMRLIELNQSRCSSVSVVRGGGQDEDETAPSGRCQSLHALSSSHSLSSSRRVERGDADVIVQSKPQV